MSAEEFSALINTARPQLWLIAAAVLADRVEAEDVVQEAAIVGLSKVGEFSRGSGFEAWMGQIVRNVARNALRKRKRRSTVDLQVAENQAVPSALTDESQPPDFRRLLGECLETLEEIARECLLLRVVGDLPYRTIAAITGLPEGTAMSHVHRARERLRTQMLERERRGRKGGAAT